ncbi:MAG: CPBP family intramembrane glutamic endopeptidase [Gaiellaceae bacterium]
MNTSFTATAGVVPAPADQAPAKVAIPQYGIRRILGVWASAALPMGALAWLVAPALKDSFAGTGSVQMVKALIVCFTAGMIWQFVLVAALLRREQGTLRWTTTREALWLRSPQSPRSGRVGGRIWLILVPLILAAAIFDGVPFVTGPSNRDFSTFLNSHAGHAFLSGAWGWYALILVMFLFNTVLGEELLFRGFLLPRMNRAFGRGDWLANGALFAAYHLHEPWAMPSAFLDTFIYAYPTKRYRSAWIGIAVHSASSVFLAIVILALVA